MDFSKLGAMLQDVKEKAEQFESESAKKEFIAKSGGGMVSVKINGNAQILDINIDDELLSDKQSLQILLISAINDAINLAFDDKKKAAGAAFNLGGLI